ncbi:MAG: hypothetical protein QXQ24_08265 [Nitrososphaeria archaeon]
MKTVKMNVTNEQTNENNEQLVKTYPLDHFNVMQLVNIENKGWQICFANAIISPEIFKTTQEAEEYIKNNLVKLLVPITTLCIERYNEFHEKKSNK